MTDSKNNTQVEEAKTLLVDYKNSIEVFKSLPKVEYHNKLLDGYSDSRHSLKKEQQDEEDINPLRFFKSQVALRSYGKDLCNYKYWSAYHTFIKKRYREICEMVILDDIGPECRLDSIKHKYHEFFQSDENIRNIWSRHISVAKAQLTGAKVKIGLLSLFAGYGLLNTEVSNYSLYFIMSVLAALAAYYIYHTTYYKTNSWDKRYGGFFPQIDYDLSSSDQLALIEFTKWGRINERVAAIMHFYGLSFSSGLTIHENKGTMIYDRDMVSLSFRLEEIKEALSDAERGKFSHRRCVQNSSKKIISENLKGEGAVLVKYIEIIIQREELYEQLIKEKEVEILEKALGEKLVHPDELLKF